MSCGLVLFVHTHKSGICVPAYSLVSSCVFICRVCRENCGRKLRPRTVVRRLLSLLRAIYASLPVRFRAGLCSYLCAPHPPRSNQNEETLAREATSRGCCCCAGRRRQKSNVCPLGLVVVPLIHPPRIDPSKPTKRSVDRGTSESSRLHACLDLAE